MSQRLTRSQAKQAKAERDQPFEFELPHTGGSALCRYRDLMDMARLGELPKSLQVEVMQTLADGRALQNLDPTDVTKIFDKPDEMASGLTLQHRMAKLYCVACFIDPVVVEFEHEMDPAREDQIWVEDIDPRDRSAFFQHITGIEQEDAKAVEPFPGEAQPAEPVVAGGPGGMAGDSALHTIEHDGLVHPIDLSGFRPGDPLAQTVGGQPGAGDAAGAGGTGAENADEGGAPV